MRPNAKYVDSSSNNSNKIKWIFKKINQKNKTVKIQLKKQSEINISKIKVQLYVSQLL